MQPPQHLVLSVWCRVDVRICSTPCAAGSLVIANISKLDASRKCFRMIGGVLVELTVGTVLPEVTTTRDQVRLRLACIARKPTDQPSTPFFPPRLILLADIVVVILPRAPLTVASRGVVDRPGGARCCRAVDNVGGEREEETGVVERRGVGAAGSWLVCAIAI